MKFRVTKFFKKEERFKRSLDKVNYGVDDKNNEVLGAD